MLMPKMYQVKIYFINGHEALHIMPAKDLDLLTAAMNPDCNYPRTRLILTDCALRIDQIQHVRWKKN